MIGKANSCESPGIVLYFTSDLEWENEAKKFYGYEKCHFQCGFKYCQNCITSNPVRSSRLCLVFDKTRYFLHQTVSHANLQSQLSNRFNI